MAYDYNKPGRDTVAHHEAGHVITYLLHGLPIRYVTLAPRTGDAVGMVQSPRPRKVHGEIMATISIAGPAAEFVHVNVIDEDASECDWSDLVGGAGLVLMNNLEYPEIARAADMWPLRPLKDMVFDTLDIVDALWQPITTVATALSASPKALTHRDVLDVIGAKDTGDARSMLQSLMVSTGKWEVA